MAGRAGVLAVVVAIALAFLSGCGSTAPQAALSAASAVSAPPPPPPAPPTPEELSAALLTEADIPGSKVAIDTVGTDSDELDQVPSCDTLAGGGDERAAVEAEAPDLELVMGQTRHTYSSMAMFGPPEELSAGVAAFASPAGATCFLDMLTLGLGSEGIDASGLTSTFGPVDIADAGGIVSLRGSVPIPFGRAFSIGADFLVFHRGQVFVMVMALSIDGNSVKGVAESLARKVDSRL